MKNRWASAVSLSLIVVLAVSFLPGQARPVYAVSPDVVISQVYGGGGNTGAPFKNDFVELFNRGLTSISLAGWSVQYASATGTGNFGSNPLALLSGTLQPGQYYLIQLAGGTNGAALPAPDATGTVNMSGTGGKVALVTSATGLACNGGSTACSAAQLALIKDLVGWDGANFYEGSAAAPATSNTTADFRANDGCTDTDNNSADFAAAAPNPRNSASPVHVCGTPTNPSGTGAASPVTVLAGDSTLLTVAVTPGTIPTSTGLAVSCDLTSIGGSAAQALSDDGSNGDVTAGDNTFSYSAVVANNTSAGDKSLPCTISDDQSRTGSASIALTVAVVTPIGTVNGAVLDIDNATAHRSPFAPPSGNAAGSTTVVVQGVIYETTLQATSFGGSYKGFYLQNTAATADGDANTSDGLFVFMNTNSTIPGPNGAYTPTVGDEVVVSGRISEFFNMTELQAPNLALLKLVRSDVDVDAEAAPVEANPPTALADANRYWERMQGMRIIVPQDSIVLGGRSVFNPADAEIWVARADSAIAVRSDPYQRRAFRDAHPLDDNYDPNNWDGNGYRILLGSLGIKASAGNKDTLIDPARTFDTLTNSPSGGLNYTFNKYRVEVTEQPTFSEGLDPSQNDAPTIIDRSLGYSIVDYNLENLYDHRNNPFSGCDYAGDTGCTNVGTPYVSPVNSPFDYVPASDGAYQDRLADIAAQIVDDLHNPDILMVQEVENQDVCSLAGGALACGAVDNADGRPDVLQDLALEIASLGGPEYDAAFDRNSSDLRGIAPSFLYRTDRVQLLPPAGDPVLGTSPAIAGFTGVPYNSDISNPKSLNAMYSGTGKCETDWVFPRAPDVALFRIYNTAVDAGPGPDSYRDVYVIDNHFKSGPDTCVAHRTAQASYNAALVAYIQAAKPDARVVVGGDLNVYPRPDDPFAPIGQAGSSDQLGSLYDAGLGLKNLWEVLLGQAPQSAYSYVFNGMAQTLDQMFLNGPLLAGLQEYRIAHINSDFPAERPGDGPRGTSDHDPGVANFVIFHWSGFFQPVDNLPELNVARAGSGIPVKFSLDGDKGLDVIATGYPSSTKIACDTSAPQDSIEQTATAGTSGLTYDPTTDTYTYVWKTNKAWAGTCRQLAVQLVDGTTHLADFKFTK